MRIASLFILAIVSTPTAAQEPAPRAAHSLETKTGCIRATYDDLFQIIEQSRSLISTANANVEKKNVRESLVLEDGTRKIELNRGFTRSMLESAPPITFDFQYSYISFDAPISDVTIRCGDFSREIHVSGTSAEQVNALHNVLVQQINSHSTPIGGVGQRVFGATALGFLAYNLLIFGLRARKRFVQILCLTSAPILILSIFFLPWNKWFAGTAVFPDSASYIVRNSATISLVGVVATIVLGVLAIAYSWYLDQRTRKNDVDELEDDVASNPQDPKPANASSKRKRASKKSQD